MGVNILIKTSQVTATPPALLPGEVAYSELSDTLFVGLASSTVYAVAGAGLFAKKASPALTGVPTAPTASTGTNTTQIATCAFAVAQAIATRLDQFAAPTAAVSLNSQKITNLATPTSAADAVRKDYVDGLISGGVNYRGSVSAAAADVDTATGTATHLPGDQYRVTTAGSLAFGFQLNVGDFVIYSGSAWQKIDSTDPAVSGTANRISVTGSADAGWTVDVSASYVGQTSITTVGTVTTGTIDGGTF